MNILSIFQPGSTVGITGQIPLSAQAGSFAIIMNESPVNLTFTFPNGSNQYVPSYDRRQVNFVGQMQQPSGFITWTIQSIPLQLPLLANQVIVELYENGECTPEIYPAPLFRQLRAFS